MTRFAWLTAVWLMACGAERLVGVPEDCLTGCYAGGLCVDGRSDAACGGGGLTCAVCGPTQSCVARRCEALPETPGDLPALSFGSGFALVDSKPLPDSVARVTTLQPEEDARGMASPVVYGLRPATRDLASLGTWEALGEAVTPVGLAVGAGDEAAAGLSFHDVFVGNRRLLMTGYKVGASHRLAVFSTDTANRPVGNPTEAVAGPFSAAPIGDFFFLSAPGVANAQGPGVFGFLDGPYVNSTRKVAQVAGPTGVGLMAAATGNVALFGVYDPSTPYHQVHACTLAQYMDAYIAAANQPWPLRLESCPQVYTGGAEVVAITRVADGFAVLERGAEQQTVRFVPLLVTGAGATQQVRAGAPEVLAEGPNAAFIESMTDYGADVLLVVNGPLGRDVQRVRRR